jgi:hypothetical protein
LARPRTQSSARAAAPSHPHTQRENKPLPPLPNTAREGVATQAGFPDDQHIEANLETVWTVDGEGVMRDVERRKRKQVAKFVNSVRKTFEGRRLSVW